MKTILSKSYVVLGLVCLLFFLIGVSACQKKDDLDQQIRDHYESETGALSDIPAAYNGRYLVFNNANHVSVFDLDEERITSFIDLKPLDLGNVQSEPPFLEITVDFSSSTVYLMRRDVFAHVEKMYAYQFEDRNLSEVDDRDYESVLSLGESWFTSYGVVDDFFASGPANQFRLPETFNYETSFASNFNGDRILLADTERPSKTWFPQDTYIIIASEEGELIKYVPFFNHLYDVEPLQLVDEVDSDRG